jgi:hypothetical protein
MAYNIEENHRFSVDLPKALAQKIGRLATKSDRSVSAMLRILIVRGLSKPESESLS